VPADPKPSRVATGKRHVFEVRRRWIGQHKFLIDERVVEFTEFLPFRPRGAQVLLDPFEPAAGTITLSGQVLSAARVLDPQATLKAWCDGNEVTVERDGSFTATTKLHAGTDQIHVRAEDATRLAGRGYVATWTPQPESADGQLTLDGNAGASCSRRPPA